MKTTFMETLQLIHSDMLMRCDYEHKKLSVIKGLRFCFYSATACTIVFRLQHFLYHHHLKWLAHVLSLINSLVFTVKIDSSASIGPGFIILHASCIRIGPGVSIGPKCVLAHQNTITHDQVYREHPSNPGAPQIGSHLFMGTGAVITGAVTLGNHVQISANALVDKNQPDHAVLFGVPARNLAKRNAHHHA